MPALADVPNVARADIGWVIGADMSASTRLFIAWSGTAPTNANCVSLATSVYTAVAAEMCPYMNDVNGLAYVKFTDLTSPTAGLGEYVHVTAGGISGGGDLLPASACFVSSGKIARRYRGGKPRQYWPLGSATSLTTEQAWLGAFVSNVQAALDALKADIATYSAGGCALGDLVNVSYYSGFTVRPSPPIAGVRAKNISTPRVTPLVDPYVTWVGESYIGSQRRRNQAP